MIQPGNQTNNNVSSVGGLFGGLLSVCWWLVGNLVCLWVVGLLIGGWLAVWFVYKFVGLLVDWRFGLFVVNSELFVSHFEMAPTQLNL